MDRLLPNRQTQPPLGLTVAGSRFIILLRLVGCALCELVAGLHPLQLRRRRPDRTQRQPVENFGGRGHLCQPRFLIYFKYANFFVDNLNHLKGSAWTLANVVLPLDISFFTFTQIAYLVDTAQGKVKAFNFVRYALFVTYFPHLIAGPVLHHAEMMPQFTCLDRHAHSI
jgi:D-alanyl-lipoteichoic acid acyltransferase DltB (MBOAT superfamily)